MNRQKVREWIRTLEIMQMQMLAHEPTENDSASQTVRDIGNTFAEPISTLKSLDSALRMLEISNKSLSRR